MVRRRPKKHRSDIILVWGDDACAAASRTYHSRCSTREEFIPTHEFILAHVHVQPTRPPVGLSWCVALATVVLPKSFFSQCTWASFTKGPWLCHFFVPPCARLPRIVLPLSVLATAVSSDDVLVTLLSDLFRWCLYC